MFDVTSETRDDTFVIILKSRLTLQVILPARASVVFWPSTRPNMPFQSDAPEERDTFQWPVIKRNRVGRFGWRNGTR